MTILPSIARASVASSANSKSEPTGKPRAIRVTFIPKGLSSFAKYKTVASPYTFGLRASIISSICEWATRSNNSFIFKSSGPIPSSGESAPPRT